MTLFFSLLSSIFTPPPFLLPATLNSPSLIQLPGRRYWACRDHFTMHGSTSCLDHLYHGRCGTVCHCAYLLLIIKNMHVVCVHIVPVAANTIQLLKQNNKLTKKHSCCSRTGDSHIAKAHEAKRSEVILGVLQY